MPEVVLVCPPPPPPPPPPLAPDGESRRLTVLVAERRPDVTPVVEEDAMATPSIPTTLIVNGLKSICWRRSLSWGLAMSYEINNIADNSDETMSARDNSGLTSDSEYLASAVSASMGPF